MKKISPTLAVVFEAIAAIAIIIWSIVLLTASRGERDEVMLFGGGLALLVSVPGIIASTVLHYRCWKTIPRDIARTTPGLAVGLLFVPFFNFYWYFISYAGLAEDLAKALKADSNHRGLGIALGIISISCWTFLADGPGLILLAVVYFVLWLIYTLLMVDGANRLLERNAEESSDTPEAGQQAN